MGGGCGGAGQATSSSSGVGGAVGSGGAGGTATAACRSAADIAAIPGILIPAIPSGATPAQVTAALQTALDTARTQGLVVFLPPGDYPVTDAGSTNKVALTCRQDVDGTPHTAEGRFHPCVIVGSTCDPTERARILLDDSASDDATLLYVYADPGDGTNKFNENYNHLIRGVVLSTGSRAHAAALNFRAAQGSTLQDVVIDLSGSTTATGLIGGPGSGGSIANVTIIGGGVGLDYTHPGEQPTVTAVTLRGQHQSAILKGGHNTLVGVGVRVEDFHGAVAIDRATSGDDSSSAITLVDSTIDFATDSPGPDRIALRTVHSAYTENVYVRNATAIVAAASGSASIAPLASAGPSDWVHLVDGSLAIDFGDVPGTMLVPTSHIWGTTGCGAGCRQYVGALSIEQPPADLAGSSAEPGAVVTRHGFGRVVDFEDSASVIVQPNGQTDGDIVQAALDAAAATAGTVVLAKGEYLLQHPVHLHAQTRLVGLAPTISILEPLGTGSDFASSQQPLVDTEVGGDTLLAFVGLYYDPDYQPLTTGAYAMAVVWKAGPNSVFRSPFPNFLNNSQGVDGPLFDIQGGGRFFNVWGAQQSLKKGTDYRVFRIGGQNARFYEFDNEHAAKAFQASYGINAEVGPTASGVRLYGVKFEAGNPDCVSIWMHGASDVRIYGHGGRGRPGTAPGLYHFESVSNVRVANLVEDFSVEGTEFGTFSVLDVDGVKTLPEERPALYVIP